MFKIVICDDQREILESTAAFIREVLAGREFEVDCYDSAETLLDGDIYETDVFILDIVMPETDGFELSEKLNRKSLRAKIIFLTSEVNRVFDGYKYRAYRFVAKGDEAGLKEAVLSAYEAKSDSTEIRLNVKNSFDEKQPLKINRSHIIYFEYNVRQLSVMTLKGRFDVWGEKLSDFTEKLSPLGFVCVHRSYLVNMAHISRFEKNDIVLSNGERIYIGSKPAMVRQIKQQYFRYIEEDG